MIRALIILAALVIAGCGTPRPINPGAAWEIYLVDQATFAAWYPYMDGSAVCDFDRQRLVLVNEDTPAVREACRQMIHEPGHPYERRHPDIWRLIAAFDAPGFNVLGHGSWSIPPPRLVSHGR